MITGHSHVLAHLPEMLDGETLYSWVTRYHRERGHVNSKSTSLQLFGDELSAFRPGLPSQLGHFEAATNGAFGTAEHLAYSRSLLRFFIPFVSEASVTKAVSRMTKGELRGLSGMVGFGFWLKACPDCMQEDKKKYHTTMWHLDHQSQASWVCTKHQCWLNIEAGVLSVNYPSSKLLLLPHEIKKNGWAAMPSCTPALKERLIKVAELVSHVMKTGYLLFDFKLLRQTYLAGMRDRGWLKPDRVIKDTFWWAFDRYYAGLDDMRDLAFSDWELTDQKHIFDTWRIRFNHHPTRHLLMMAFLFESPESFERAYSDVVSAASASTEDGAT